MVCIWPARGTWSACAASSGPTFPLLRVLADRSRRPARFLVLGSASPDPLRQSSESLAGRAAYHELGGFSLEDVGPTRADRLWLREGVSRARSWPGPSARETSGAERS